MLLPRVCSFMTRDVNSFFHNFCSNYLIQTSPIAIVMYACGSPQPCESRAHTRYFSCCLMRARYWGEAFEFYTLWFYVFFLYVQNLFGINAVNAF